MNDFGHPYDGEFVNKADLQGTIKFRHNNLRSVFVQEV